MKNINQNCFDEEHLLSGEYKEYHKNGLLKEHCFYIDELLTGEFKSYYDNGQLKAHCLYKEDELDGECKWYLPNGKLKEHFFFVDGSEIPITDYIADYPNITNEELFTLSLMNIKLLDQ